MGRDVTATVRARALLFADRLALSVLTTSTCIVLCRSTQVSMEIVAVVVVSVRLLLLTALMVNDSVFARSIAVSCDGVSLSPVALGCEMRNKLQILYSLVSTRQMLVVVLAEVLSRPSFRSFAFIFVHSCMMSL